MATRVTIRNKGPWSDTPHSQDEDHIESTRMRVVSILVQVHLMDHGAIEPHHSSIYYDNTIFQPTTIIEGLYGI